MKKEDILEKARKDEDEMEKEGINAEVNVDESSGEVNIELKAN